MSGVLNTPRPLDVKPFSVSESVQSEDGLRVA